MIYRRNNSSHLGVLVAICFFVAGGFPGEARADVDFKNLNYWEAFVDLIDPSGFMVSRNYNSRSLHDGYFGFGWCSDLETQLSRSGNNLIVLPCGDGVPTVFRPISAVRSEGAFTENWQSSDGARATFANRAYDVELVPDPAYRLQTRVVFKFDTLGQLTAIQRPGFANLRLERTNGRIARISLSSGSSFSIEWGSNGKVLSIVGSSQNQIRYRYDLDGNLIFAKDMWGKSYAYVYDDLHNLIKATWPDQTYIELKYDKEKDWVSNFKDRSGCQHTYKAEFSSLAPREHYWIYLDRKCGERERQELHEYLYRQEEAEARLWRYRLTKDGEFRETTYSLKDGSVVARTLPTPAPALHKPLIETALEALK